MAQYQHQWPVVVLCAVLEVRRSGFYPSVHRHAPTQRGGGGRPRGAGESDSGSDTVELWEPTDGP